MVTEIVSTAGKGVDVSVFLFTDNNNNNNNNNTLYYSCRQAVVRGTTNPAPVLPRSQRPKTAISLYSQPLGGSTGLPENHNQWNWTSRLHSLGGSTF